MLNLYNKWFRYRRLLKSAVWIDFKSVLFASCANIKLGYDSSKNNIIIGKNVYIRGLLFSMGGGDIVIGDSVFIGSYTKILAVNNIMIGKYTQIANNVTICDNNNHPVNPLDREIVAKTPPYSKERSWLYSQNAPIIIGENCWLGEYCRICKGVSIGNGSVVAANSVVTKDVPENCIVAGNPAIIVKREIDKTTSRILIS